MKKLLNRQFHKLYSSTDIIWKTSEDRGVDGRKGLKWILGRPARGCGVDSPGLE
jgi:hypothetical protein